MRKIWLFSLSVLAWAQPPEVSLISPACDAVSFVGSGTQFIAFSLETGISYKWTLSDGRVLEGSSVNVNFDEPGLYEVTLVATNSRGESTEPMKRQVYFTDVTGFQFAPSVRGTNASPSVARPGEPVRIEPIISDPDRDGPYTYYWCWTKDNQVFRSNSPVLETSFNLDPGEVSRTYDVNLFVVDQAGYASFVPSVTSIFVSTGNLPPIAKIVEPADSIVDVQVGTTLNFRAEVIDREGDLPIAYQWITPDGNFNNEETFSYTFNQEGFFSVVLTTTDSLGNESPNSQVVLIQVAAATNPDIPDPIILLPSVSTRVFTGESLILSGLIAGSNQNREGFWQVLNFLTGQEVGRIEGNQPGRYKFTQQGLFVLRFNFELFGMEAEETAANTRLISVQTRDQNQAPNLRYPPNYKPSILPNGATINLDVEGEDVDGTISRYVWTVEGELQNEQGPSISVQASVSADNFTAGVGVVQTQVTAIDNLGKPAREPIIFVTAVYEDRVPPEPTVNDLTSGDVVFRPFDQPYPISATVANDPGEPLRYFWTVSYIDDFLNPIFNGDAGPTLPSLNLTRPGIVSVSLQVFTQDNSLRSAFGHAHYLYAFDPNGLPTPTITRPIENPVITEVGTDILFEGLVSDPNLFVNPEDAFGFIRIDTQMVWSVVKNGSVITTIEQNEPLAIRFDEPGEFQVRLEATNKLGLRSTMVDVVPVRVVGLRTDESLEPNNTRETAANLTLGGYGGLSVDADDPVDWYAFTLNEVGSAIDFQIDLTAATDQAQVNIFQGDQQIVSNTLEAGKRHPFTFIGSKAGTYLLELRNLATGSGKRAVSFGLTLSVSNPRLVFGYPKTDEVDETLLTLVNPTQSEARATLIARNEKGESIGEVDMKLDANGHNERKVMEIFPSLNPLDIAWVQVRSDQNIVGLSTTLSRDELSAVAEPAIIGNLDELVIPHIAQDTNVWFTQASLINQASDMADARFQSAAGEFEVPNLESVHQGTLVDFEQFFGGSLPQGSEWGRVLEANAQPGLAGMEIFGTKNGSPRIAALNLSSEKLRNPNFTYINNNLYFPHIAEDRANFFTGVAFVNTSEAPVDIQLIGYSRQGQVLATLERQLTGLEKVVNLAENLFENLPADGRLSWLELKTSGPVQGYTVFGDNRGDNALLAGLTAIGGGTREVVFQKVLYEQGKYWTGLAVVNISATNAANLTYEAFDNEGRMLGRVTRGIDPHVKDLNLIENLFESSILADIRWVKLTADQPVAAFELFGDLAGNFLAGSVAQ